MNRSFTLFTITLLLVVLAGPIGNAAGQPASPSPTPPFPWYEKLEDAEKELFRAIAEEQFCPCGQPRSFNETLAAKEACSDAIQLGRFLAQAVQGTPSKRRVVKKLLKRMATISARVQLQTKGNLPRLGDPDAPIQVVVFSDFQCPYCSKVGAPLKAAAKAGDVALVYKYYPLSFHKQAKGAAQAACAAQLQGKFWAMHDALFEAQKELESGDFSAMARKAGLNLKRYESDWKSEMCVKAVEDDLAEGDRIQLQGTPSVYVNGLVVEQLETLEAAIQEAREFELK